MILATYQEYAIGDTVYGLMDWNGSRRSAKVLRGATLDEWVADAEMHLPTIPKIDQDALFYEVSMD